MTQTRLALGYLRALLTTPLEQRERARCFGVLTQWLSRDHQARIVMGEWRIRARQAWTLGTLA